MISRRVVDAWSCSSSSPSSAHSASAACLATTSLMAWPWKVGTSGVAGVIVEGDIMIVRNSDLAQLQLGASKVDDASPPQQPLPSVS